MYANVQETDTDKARGAARRGTQTVSDGCVRVCGTAQTLSIGPLTVDFDSMKEEADE